MSLRLFLLKLNPFRKKPIYRPPSWIAEMREILHRYDLIAYDVLNDDLRLMVPEKIELAISSISGRHQSSTQQNKR